VLPAQPDSSINPRVHEFVQSRRDVQKARPTGSHISRLIAGARARSLANRDTFVGSGERRSNRPAV
jgi:hypothetical protein